MSDLKDQIFEKVSADKDLFKKIVSKIPGFGGYVERQTRRDADKLLRETIAKRFEVQGKRLSALQREMINMGAIASLDDLEAAAIKLRIFIDRVRRAPRGYSSLFEAVKINQEELGILYQYDAAMLEMADEVARSIDNVEASVGGDGLPAAIRHLVSTAEQCVEVYDRREEAVVGSVSA